MRIRIAFLLPFLALLGAAESQPGHRMLISGCNLGHISVVEPDGSVRWTWKEKREASDAWLLPDADVVFSYKEGVRRVHPDWAAGEGGSTVWNWEAPKGGEAQGCQPLPDGGFLIGVSMKDVAYLIEITVDASGTIHERSRLTLNGLGGPHTTFRQVRKTTTGTYLVTQQRAGGVAMEFAADGSRVRTFPDGRYVAERLANGNTLIACGDNHRVIEVDPAGTVVWELGAKDIAGATIGFAAGVQRLPNGNTVITNWGGHGGSNGPAVMEVTPDKKMVWQLPGGFPDRISNIHVLDGTELPPKR